MDEQLAAAVSQVEEALLARFDVVQIGCNSVRAEATARWLGDPNAPPITIIEETLGEVLMKLLVVEKPAAE